MISVTKVPFITTLAHIVVGMKSRPHILRGTKLLSVHTNMPREVNKIFIGQPSNLRGGGSGLLGSLGPLEL
jgi:hypothetical protein